MPATAGGSTSGSSISVISERRAREALRASRYAVGVPKSEHRHVRDQARLQADDERVADDVVAELVEKVAERNAQEDRDERQQQEREGDAGRDGSRRREERAAHCFRGGRPNPARLSSAGLRVDSTL